jgi:Zn-dependent protease
MYSEPRDVIDADYRVTPTGEIEGPRKQPRWRTLLGPLAAALIFIATKFKFVFAAVKGLPFLTTGVTAVLSIGAYAWAFGWQFGVGLVALIFIHEMGHVLALRRYGVKASAPIFIPFLGAFIGMKQLPKNATMEAVVGLGGPIIGSLGALAAWVLYTIDGHPIFLVMAYFGVLLNLFNLLPVLPLDGGRAVGAISRWLWVAGYAGLLLLMLWRPSPILLIILLFGAPEVWHAIRRGRSPEDAYYAVPFSHRVAVGATYFGLMLVLGLAFYELSPMIYDNRPS